MKRHTRAAIVAALAAGLSIVAMAGQPTVEVEVTFKDHWGKASEVVHVTLPVGAAARHSIVEVPNPQLPGFDLLKLAVVQRAPDGDVDLLAEEQANRRIVGAIPLRSDSDPAQQIEVAQVGDLHGFEPHSVAVGDQFEVAAGPEVLSVVRRIR